MDVSRGQKRPWVSSSFFNGNENVNSDLNENKNSSDRLSKLKLNLYSKYKSKSNDTKETLWIDAHEPLKKEDIAVQKKKVGEVEEWLIKYFSPSSENGVRKSSILVLTGPSGVGKTATVKILAKYLKLEIKEWITPISELKTEFDDNNSGFKYTDSALPYESQLNIFWDFFLRANKYSSLCFVDEEEDGDDELARIILVEDFPNIFVQNPTEFHSTLRKFNQTSRSPAVFIISDNIKDLNTRTLFPQELQNELAIVIINFNPVTTKNLLKVLTKIASTELSPIPSKQILENIAQASSGDIRMAINALQFSHCDNKKMNDSQPDFKDTTLYLFHAIGKIVHCKRDSSLPTDESDLPLHLKKMARLPLMSNPESIVNSMGISSDYLNLFIHHNYLKFNDDIGEVTRASRYLSDADVLTSEWTGRSVLEEYSSLIGVRGVMHAKNAQSPSVWSPFHKPFWYNANKLLLERKWSLNTWNRDLRLTNANLVTEMLPYSKLIGNLPWPKEANILIKDLTTFSRHSIKNEELLEQNEMADTEDLTLTQVDITNKPSKSEVIAFANEDDFIIEEYSD